MAIFDLIVGASSYVSFPFGFARDTWNPFGMRIAVSWCCSAACARPCMWRLRSCL